MDYKSRTEEFSQRYLNNSELKLDFRGRAELSLLLVDNGFKPECEHDSETNFWRKNRGVDLLKKGAHLVKKPNTP